MVFSLKKNLKIFSLIFCTIFLLGCIKKDKKIEKKFIFQETSIDDVLDSGIFIFPNSINVKAFKEEDFFVCNYEVFLIPDKKQDNKNEILNNFLESFIKIYINEGWVLQEPIFTEDNVNISGYKEDKSIFIVIFNNFLKKIGKYKMTVHTAINIFS